jgi:DNA-binding NarL/FixJ family response regulator
MKATEKPDNILFEFIDPDQVDLTHKESEIFLLIAKGLLNKEIANHMNISLNTVKRHVCNLFHKLSVRNRAEAVCFWHKQRNMDDRSSLLAKMEA